MSNKEGYHKERYERMKAQGVCVRCGKSPAEEATTTCKSCKERNLNYSREYRKTPRYRENYKEYMRKYYREHQRDYYQTIDGKFYHDRNAAKQRAYFWELSIDQAGFCYTQPCHYCGDMPNGKLNGIDRQDSSVGYTIENIVPCCPTCNYAKLEMSPEEFIWHCNKVAQFNKR